MLYGISRNCSGRAWPEQSEWAVDVLNELIDSLHGVRIGLHVCGGNPRRKRVYFTKYTDLAPAFRKAHISKPPSCA